MSEVLNTEAIGALIPKEPHAAVAVLTIKSVNEVDHGDEKSFEFAFSATVNGKPTEATVSAGNLPAIGSEPTQLDKMIVSRLVASAVDALLMQRAYDDGIPTVYEDGEALPHDECKWNEEATAMLLKAGIDVRKPAAASIVTADLPEEAGATEGQAEASSQSEPQPEVQPEPARTVIQPTIGRRLWYWPNDDDLNHTYEPTMAQRNDAQAFDAGVVFVHENGLINVTVADHIGRPFARQRVTLLQEGEELPRAGGFCTWMPYQTSSAKKGA